MDHTQDAGDPAIALLDQFGFHHRLEQTPGVSLVIFTAPACGACRHWRQLLLRFRDSDPDVSAFEVDVQRDQALAREFCVNHLPALFVFVDGRFHCELQAEARLPVLRESLQTALAAQAQEPP